jgi:hypothetical protein
MGGKVAEPDIFLAAILGMVQALALNVAGGPDMLVGVFGEGSGGCRWRRVELQVFLP